VVEGGGLLNRYTGNTVSEVRILSSPPVILHLFVNLFTFIRDAGI